MLGSEQESYVTRTSVQDRRTGRIRELNDELRRTGQGGRFVMTRGVSQLPDLDVTALMRAIREFDDFSADNDPHGEHDFGAFEHAGERMFWKIDYYDAQLVWGSPDLTDTRVTTRVLTIMLASEY
jgi:hypothetical protein